MIGFEPAAARLIFTSPGAPRTWKASTPPSGSCRRHVFISECYGPGSALLEGQARRLRHGLERGQEKDEEHAGPLEHADRCMRAICTPRAAGMRTLAALHRAVHGECPVVAARPVPQLALDGGMDIYLQSEVGPLVLLKVKPEEVRPGFDFGSNRTRQGRAAAEKSLLAAPVLANGLLYVRSDERLVCWS